MFLVDNRGPEAVEVFLHRGVLLRIGTVPAQRSVQLTSVAARAPGVRMRLVARPLSGAGSVSTEELLVGPGGRIRWTITLPLRQSSITAIVEPAPVAPGAAGCGGPPR